MVKNEVKSTTEVDGLLGEARGLVKGFQASRRRSGNHLKKDLARGRNQVRSEVKQMLAGFRRARKNNGAAPGLGGNGPRQSKAPVEGGLGMQVLGAVKDHPEGITLAAVADSLGIARVVLGRILSGLVAGGRVRKQGRDYFPLAG